MVWLHGDDQHVKRAYYMGIHLDASHYTPTGWTAGTVHPTGVLVHQAFTSPDIGTAGGTCLRNGAGYTGAR